MRLLKDPLFRRFLSGTLFASAFVWVAVEFFGVETEVIEVLFIYSVGFVALLSVGGILLVPLVRFFRPARTGILEKTEIPTEPKPQEQSRSDGVE